MKVYFAHSQYSHAAAKVYSPTGLMIYISHSNMVDYDEMHKYIGIIDFIDVDYKILKRFKDLSHAIRWSDSSNITEKLRTLNARA